MANRHNFKLNCSSKVDIKERKNSYYNLYTIIIHNKYYYKILNIFTYIFFTDQRKPIRQRVPTATYQ